ncbi:MAG TPA: hypothetical protein VKZ50_02320 [bacterium]|nr:hypothetical protein [bacterium]
MTIAIAISLSEGIVLAADGRTTRWRQTGDHRAIDVLTDSARKIFPLGPQTAAVTHGRSHLRGDTIAALAARYAARLAPEASRDVTTIVDGFLASLGREDGAAASDQAPDAEPVGFLIGGYGPDGVGRIYEAAWPAGERRLLSTTDAPNYHWRGQGHAITRLFKGIDPAVDLSLLDAKTAEIVARLEYLVPLRQMSLVDGVALAKLLGSITLGVARFARARQGEPDLHQLVGGRLTVATVTLAGYRRVRFTTTTSDFFSPA